ncbi:MAG: hypothetical protein C3F13_06685 [Anaerolineales bacterium]|nr:hypothetical protein [Anaerolineae bacterium]PWB54436.1 MAG: hypothetical protein C3F13_06685 [Anaerolineales bacterium]
MNTGGILNRVEIVMYSTLTSMLSGVNHLRGIPGQSAASLNPPAQAVSEQQAHAFPQAQKFSLSIIWDSIKEIVPPLFFWLVLGFAAGFLIGMVQPR